MKDGISIKDLLFMAFIADVIVGNAAILDFTVRNFPGILKFYFLLTAYCCCFKALGVSFNGH